MYLLVESLMLTVFLQLVSAVVNSEVLTLENLLKDKTELVCDFEEMILSCPDNYHIDVLSAMYGKIDNRYCYQRHKRVDNCEANSLTTLNQVRKKCNRLQYCSLMAHSKMLGNPCKGIRKYLEVTYRCLRSVSDEILTKIVCQDQKLDLKCPSGHLKVVKAFYGRTTKPYCLDETKDIATTCEVSRATFLVQNRCNEWRNCTFTVNSKMIRDDACRSAFKFLEVLYFCERSDNDLKRVCQDELLVLACPSKYSIQILSAFFGKKDEWYCEPKEQNFPNCETSGTLEIAKNWCDLKEQCTLVASAKIFGDPCPIIRKYLEVSYECIKKDEWKEAVGEGEELELACLRGTVLDIQTAFFGSKSESCQQFEEQFSSETARAVKAIDVMKAQCNERQACFVQASTSIFTDTCPNNTKYLEVSYKCKESIKPFEILACELEKLYLRCPKDKYLWIVYTFFGRVNPKLCFVVERQTSRNQCVSKKAPKILESSCNYKNNCSISVNSAVLGNVCPDTYKYLEVDYLCLKNISLMEEDTTYNY
ncbi:uncharacterized protein isoform X2 [Rhodnius prolixus]|uniref:uncharacterized protein isoform X2 n=1 Tax=Rhodnius prolixus TaxID=13249 RepID=UPI003D18873E